jgi:enoyl-[acyl-carrier protein] reductase I
MIDEVVEYCETNAPLPERLTTREVANVAAFLSCPLSSGITGTTLFVDKGFHAMGKALAEADYWWKK